MLTILWPAKPSEDLIIWTGRGADFAFSSIYAPVAQNTANAAQPILDELAQTGTITPPSVQPQTFCLGPMPELKISDKYCPK